MHPENQTVKAMTTIVKEKEGCVIYRDGDVPIRIETPLYEETDSYREYAPFAMSPADGTLAEGIRFLHMYAGGTELTPIPKTDFLLEAAEDIYNIGKSKANNDGYKPWDESVSGQAGKKKMIDTIAMVLVQLKRAENPLRIPYLMQPDLRHVHYARPFWFEVWNYDMANVNNSIWHTTPPEWNYTEKLLYSFVFINYNK